VHDILWPLRGHHSTHVFTFVAQRTRDGRTKGERYPITYNGLKSHWRYLRRVAQVPGFRWHDFRHDVATKMLRETRNLKLVQRAMGHAKITTTMRYAHVLDAEIAEGFEAVAKSRTKSRTGSLHKLPAQI
jgi:integrase